MSYIDIRKLRKSYGAGLKPAVDGIDLSIDRGEFVTLLGSSGCGKTTTLRCIAGLERPDSGEILLDGKDITYDQPSERDMRMVFQDYALFPNLTIADNVAFGLRLKRYRGRYTPEQVKRRIGEYLDLVHLADHGGKKPHQLSGGQKQRAALARALITEPDIVLFDEPLGSLDANLRKAMQIEIKRIHRQLGKTFIYVTHDQEEAMAMSDRIVVMNGGRILQVASPEEIYAAPNCQFVARFIDRANVLSGIVVSTEGGQTQVRLGDGQILRCEGNGVAAGSTVGVMMRADRINIAGGPVDGMNMLKGMLAERLFLGAKHEFVVDLAGEAGQLNVFEQEMPDGLGGEVMLSVSPQDVRLLAE
ncbi:ABC transporter ATP-binding protein [Methyloligella sp. 2.7D]|uniref:ABC transporter ATP-binding protein n=1 Tax=unclassified Methyloligella TaxID=2625955 RepID=UPI00157D60DB|nr:ABC transporter ATP-binding protein [Methyloligella sp. GL2]QKP78096.1 ABC transporter ATP-binding protein [Methyloligella sp. GL2]